MFKKIQRSRVFKRSANKYNSIPTLEQLEAVNGIDLGNPFVEDVPARVNWFMDEFETFCRHKALEKAILDSTDLLEQQDYGSVETMIKEASQ